MQLNLEHLALGPDDPDSPTNTRGFAPHDLLAEVNFIAFTH